MWCWRSRLRFSWTQGRCATTYLGKVKILWEGHNIWKNLPPFLTKQLFLLSSVKTGGRFFFNFCGLFRKAVLNFNSTYSVAYFLFFNVRLLCFNFSMVSFGRPLSFNFLLRSLMFRDANSSSEGRILCFKFSLNPLKCSLMRETDIKLTRSKSWAIWKLQFLSQKMTKTPISPNYQVPNGYFDISLQVIYDCSCFVSW